MKIRTNVQKFLPFIFCPPQEIVFLRRCFFMSDKKFANLDRKSLDRLNDMQHEITDAEGKGVILVAFDRDCGGCKGGCGCH